MAVRLSLPFGLELLRKRRSPSKALLRFTNVLLVIGTLAFAVVGSVFAEAQLRDESMDTWADWLSFLGESVVLGTLESFSILTALGIFILEGRHEQKKMQRYMAWAVLDLANRRETSSGRVQALQDLNEAGVSLGRYDFPHADLFGIQLPGADLHEATLTCACLEEADLSKAILHKANLVEANLEKVNFEEACLEFAHLENANLQRAMLKGAGLLGANFTHANLRAANCMECDLRHADFTNATLAYADLVGSDLFAANLTDADVTGANFRNVNNLSIEQVKRARNWKFAKYDADFSLELGLPVQEREAMS